MPPQPVKLIVFDRLYHLMCEAGKNASKARHIYKINFDQNVRHSHQFIVDDVVYVDNSPTANYHQELTSAGNDPSEKLWMTKHGP